MGRAGENWSSWLKDNLEAQGYTVAMPTLPGADHPDRQTWLSEITNEMNDLGDNTIIIAHSLGVTSALDFLEQHTDRVKGLVSVSGFADDYGLELNSYFMREKPIDFDAVSQSLEHAVALYGDNDPYVPQESLELLATKLGVAPIIIQGGGHLNEAAGYQEFPQLLETMLAMG